MKIIDCSFSTNFLPTTTHLTLNYQNPYTILILQTSSLTPEIKFSTHTRTLYHQKSKTSITRNSREIKTLPTPAPIKVSRARHYHYTHRLLRSRVYIHVERHKTRRRILKFAGLFLLHRRPPALFFASIYTHVYARKRRVYSGTRACRD